MRGRSRAPQRSGALSCAALLSGMPAWSQDGPEPGLRLEPVTVTAERHETQVQKTSISMQVVPGRDIARQGLSSAAEILKNVANVEVQGAARGNVIAMRGIGSDLPPGMGESAVSTNFDGVYNFRPEMNTLGFFDLDRVEVLRGPQGTLYGRNAAAGAVNYITRDPLLGGGRGGAALEAGSRRLLRGEFGFDLPLGDTVALRASGAAIRRDGYLSDGFNDAKGRGARLKLLFQPDERWRLLLGGERIDLRGKGPGRIPQTNWANPDTRLQAAVAAGDDAGIEKIGHQDYTAHKLWAQLDWNLGIGVLTLLPAHQTASGVVYRRYDASRPPALREQYNADPARARQDSVELRMASPKESPWAWVAGVYRYDMLNVSHCLAGISCESAGTRDTTLSTAAFGQATLPLAAGRRLVIGVRRTLDRKTAINGTRGDWHSTDGKLGVEFDLGNRAMAYASLATAYRPGGINTLPGNSGTFDAEKLKSFELGLKSRWMDDRLQLNGALFHYDYRNYQAIDFVRLDTGALHAKFLNLPRQTIRGLEADARALLGAGGELRAALTWLDAELGELTLTRPDGSTFSLAGNPLPHAPRYTVRAGYEHAFERAGGAVVALRLDLRHTAAQYVSITENAFTLQPRYSQVDLFAAFRSHDDRWAVHVYVKNATDHVPKIANMVGYTLVGSPRTGGVVLTVRF